MGVIMKVENVSKHFAGLKALNKVSLEINDDEIFGIIGPNGAGKTTFFNVISGFNSPTSGKVFFAGKEMTGSNITQFCTRGIARTFQNIRIFSEMTVMENLLVGMHNRIHSTFFGVCMNTRKQRDVEKKAADKAMEIMEYLNIATFANEYAANLSYGTQRLVEIGRALASEPKLLLLDEPSAGMNQQETMELMKLIQGIRKLGPAIIVIEHNMKFMMNLSYRIAVLNFGELLMVDTPKEVQEDPRVIEAYLGKGEEY
ncbi:MAG: ABC transporter ATP-binding protein [Clostridiales bacterium]|nr:ABC transporter ATP-binding protein [Clostridiales bacterium]